MASARKRRDGGVEDLESLERTGGSDLEDSKGKPASSTRGCEVILVLVLVGLLMGVVIRDGNAAGRAATAAAVVGPKEIGVVEQALGKPGGSGRGPEEMRTTYPRTHVARRVAEEMRLAYFTQAAAKATDPVRVHVYEDAHCRGESSMVLTREDIGEGLNLCEADFRPTGGGAPARQQRILEAVKKGGIRVEGPAELDLFKSCDGTGDRQIFGVSSSYHGTVMPMDGCTMIWDWPRTSHIRLRPLSVEDLTYQSVPRAGTAEEKLYNVIFSAESAEYFYYQAQVNLHAFKKSGNDRNGRWTRALTCAEPDDAMDIFPTFVAKRHPYSLRYSPLNKADALLKWFASPSAPAEKVQIIVDPDNWLTRDLTPIASEVAPGKAIANGAWYNSAHGRKLMMQLWQELCDEPGDQAACNAQLKVPLDLAAVPYFVHREDLVAILPRWKRLIIAIKEHCEGNEPFKARFKGLQITWGAEMLAYNFAAAEAGVRHDLRDMQVRDVDSPPGPRRLEGIYMIHMGRAWMPWDYEPGAVWQHTEGRDFARHGRQVWCKCNKTASIVRPWPIPDNLDYASRITLTYLHEAQEAYGDPPQSKYRKNGRPALEVGDYHASFP